MSGCVREPTGWLGARSVQVYCNGSNMQTPHRYVPATIWTRNFIYLRCYPLNHHATLFQIMCLKWIIIYVPYRITHMQCYYCVFRRFIYDPSNTQIGQGPSWISGTGSHLTQHNLPVQKSIVPAQLSKIL